MQDRALWLPICVLLLLEIGSARLWNAGPDIDFQASSFLWEGEGNRTEGCIRSLN